MRVVVVDDHRDVALAIEFALRAMGHDARIACDAPTALRALAEHRPQIMLIDLVLPIVNGWELAETIRELDLQTPPRLIAMSGFCSTTDRARSRTSGFEQHLAKPIGVAELMQLVELVN